ncbi:unnamed protein product [Kuraishia capsulata CBS 1993]|uniref:Amino acid transporter transmembrane domain-containing protein n=1 Tax=Kuraishia capsulata CBS 1993 TaxID=1382522 RepID=W6MK03_9ASCO|nr:uncharacterized protein KUCA_T00002848001 [Kuraishia capsulata CBS 1993]CDK26874.1 unnamed protein product [Kuraishia capsulata CBS 1993]
MSHNLQPPAETAPSSQSDSIGSPFRDPHPNDPENASLLFELDSVSTEDRHSPETPSSSELPSTQRRFDEIYEAEALAMFEQSENKSNMRMAFMNMANSILGAGIIGQPLAFKNSGVLAGLVLMVFLTVLVDWTLRLIIVNAKLSGQKTYHDTVFFCFGLPGKITILLAQGLFAYGGSMAFCVIIGDTIPHVLRTLAGDWVEKSAVLNFLLSRNVLILALSGCISYPLSLNRDISKLAKASGVALVGMLIIVTVVVVHGPQMPADLKGSISTSQWFINKNVFQGISVISFALVCHHNTTFIYESMKKPTLDRFAKLTHISCFISMIACGLMGMVGYLTFKDKTKGNILNNFPSSDWVANIARLCFGLNMLTTFPLEVFVVREIARDFLVMWKKSRESGYASLTSQSEDDQTELSDKEHFWLTTVLCFSAISVSLFTCNLGAILELVGATSASIMAYILPPMCLLKMTTNKSFLQKLPARACIVFGYVVMFLSSAQTIYGAIHTKGGEHCNVD